MNSHQCNIHACEKKLDMRYAEVYNRLFFSRARIAKHRRHNSHNDTQMSLTIRRMIQTCTTDIPSRLRLTRHLHTLALTQTIGKRLDPATKQYIYTQHRLAHLAWVISRLRPLQRRVLDRLWRPTGAMALRSIRAGLSATRDEERVVV